MSFASSVLRSCASCAEQTDGKLCCARCHTLYFSRACQETDRTSGGHKKDCAGIARARRDMNFEAQSRALARVSHMSGGAPDDAHCLACLDGDGAADPLVRGCAYRGSFGWTHATCLIQMAEAARAPPPPESPFAPWVFCPTCKQRFTDLVQLRLAIALWVKRARAVETDTKRPLAADVYATALGAAGEHEEAVRIQRTVLDAENRAWGPEHSSTLSSVSNLVASLLRHGERAEAVVLLRATLAIQTRTAGSDNVGTLTTEGHLVSALCSLGEYAEAEALSRGTLEKMRRVLGRDHRETLYTSANLAASLSRQGKYTEALEIQREVNLLRTRLLGTEHEHTLVSAANLAVSLTQCGQKKEAAQLFRDTLALSRRALGSTHEFTQIVLQNMRALGPAAPRKTWRWEPHRKPHRAHFQLRLLASTYT